jgi:glucose-1-phosphate cytidylyltransferase
MRYYAHFGHTEFILCLGYRGDLIREYFLSYNEAMSNDFTLHGAGRKIVLHSHDIDDWKITFVDTGLHSNIGQRLLRVRSYLGDDPVFLANYADGLSDLPFDDHVEKFLAKPDQIASFVAVPSTQSFHAVNADDQGVVTKLGAMPDQQLLINGGYFVLRSEVFDYINEGEELVEQPFARLIAARRLMTYRWQGFWQCMDTLKDKISFDRMEARGTCPWKVWRDQPTPIVGSDT